MTWMNRYEVQETRFALTSGDTPVAERGVMILDRLVKWTDSNSDGWSSWPKPSNAADRLMTRLKHVADMRYETDDIVDLTEADLTEALRPIKAFLTRQINAGHATEQDRTDIIEGMPVRYGHSVILSEEQHAALVRENRMRHERGQFESLAETLRSIVLAGITEQVK